MKFHRLILAFFAGLLLVSCSNNESKKETSAAPADTFTYVSETFGDVRVLRYQVPGFETLDAKQKEMLYYLYEAALSGRDMIWAQNGKYNLEIRHMLEAIVEAHPADDSSAEWKAFMDYTKRVWFSNGIHHHYGNNKLMPDFTKEYLAGLVKSLDAKMPLSNGETAEAFMARINPIIFDPSVLPKKVNKDPKADLILTSATGFYDGVTQKEVSDFYGKQRDKTNPKPVMYGLNSTLVKENGKVVEKVWKVGGHYTQSIEKVVYWLEKASGVAENANQKKALDLLIEYYKTGDLKKFDEYCIAWVADTASRIDVVNGFIEVYGDPLGYKGSYEAVVSIRDMDATKRIATIGDNAQWFEDNSTLMPDHKKKNVTGISAKVITVVIESGDASPSTPIGINLPNSNWIRQDHGSKSVNLGNIVGAYNMAKGGGMLDEFYYSEEMKERSKLHAVLADNLHTDLHEVIGHASGQLNPGIEEPHHTLKNYASTLEEARADLVGLYYIMDQKLIDIGVMSTLDVGKTQYESYIMNGMMLQLRRVTLGNDIEEDHMRNRQLIAHWAFEKGAKDSVISKVVRDGKTFFVVNNYEKLRTLFGELLREIQRIKSEGDYQAGHDLVEAYGVKVDATIHAEMLERYKKLNLAPYQGFINPRLVATMDGDKVSDVQVEYPMDFKTQMMEYGKKYSTLPAKQ